MLKVIIYYNNKLYNIDVICKKIVKDFENNNSIGLIINEIKINDNLINDKIILESFLFECQCALFLIDITSIDSFNLIKSLFEKQELLFNNNQNNNILKKILILNKVDLELERKIPQEEITSFLNKNTNLEYLEISLKTLKGIQELSNKMLLSYQIIKENKIPTDYIYEIEESIKNPKIIKDVQAEGTINCIIIGETEVGKSSFLVRYFKDQFNESFLTTVGIDKETKIIKIQNHLYKLTVWDTAGQERFRCIPITYYQNADGILLFFDVHCRKSFNNLDVWVEDIKKNIDTLTNTNMFLIGNKIDLKREISKEEAIGKAKELGIEYFETSAKINMNVNEIMSRMIVKCYTKLRKKNKGETLDKKHLNKKKKGSGCC